MTLAAYESTTCSVARTLEVLGDRWTLLVIRDLFNGVRRFDALQDHLGVSRDVLAKRLARLVDEGLVARRPYRQEGDRTRHEYVLTADGRSLRTVVTAIMDWGDQHRATADGPPMSLRHRDCGAAVHAHLACDDGHVVDDATRTEVVPLAGARRRDRA